MKEKPHMFPMYLTTPLHLFPTVPIPGVNVPWPSAAVRREVDLTNVPIPEVTQEGPSYIPVPEVTLEDPTMDPVPESMLKYYTSVPIATGPTISLALSIHAVKR
jgi:hypothetical protein